MKLLVCGGAGFIGSTFVRQRLLEHGDEITVLDKLTYAGREENFHDFAEETHVDRSIAEPDAFVSTHALGTYVLLEAARTNALRYVQVSTDEVYGSIEQGSFTEDSPLRPSSPYSATK